jgi:hypothetical protein
MVAGELLRTNALEAGPAAEEASGLKDSDFFESFE